MTSQASAAIVTTTLVGTNVVFTDIQESGNSTFTAASATYGDPSIVNDSLEFSPSFFSISSAGSVGPVSSIDGQLRFTATGLGGSLINSITINEGGLATTAVALGACPG